METPTPQPTPSPPHDPTPAPIGDPPPANKRVSDYRPGISNGE
jgi:hypothetical protein